MADTIDEIAGERFILGLGAGWIEEEYRAFGFPFDHRASRFEEAITTPVGVVTESSSAGDSRQHQPVTAQQLPVRE